MSTDLQERTEETGIEKEGPAANTTGISNRELSRIPEKKFQPRSHSMTCQREKDVHGEGLFRFDRGADTCSLACSERTLSGVTITSGQLQKTYGEAFRTRSPKSIRDAPPVEVSETSNLCQIDAICRR